MTDEFAGTITEIQNQLNFVLSDNGRNKEGHTVFTIVSNRTGTRFTYRVKRANKFNEQSRKWEPSNVWFVSVLSGSDNQDDYRFIGTIFDRGVAPKFFAHSNKSKVSKSASSFVAFSWYFNNLIEGNEDAINNVEFFHQGICGRCGRELTVPSSIETGLGSICASKIGA